MRIDSHASQGVISPLQFVSHPTGQNALPMLVWRVDVKQRRGYTLHPGGVQKTLCR
jgi:hypothetical protein